jgi:hypothetical protein
VNGFTVTVYVIIVVAQFRGLLIFRLFLLISGRRFRDFGLGLLAGVLLLGLVGTKRDWSSARSPVDARWGRGLFCTRSLFWRWRLF